jgi:U3 small nucleolar RNA-associated protein 20
VVLRQQEDETYFHCGLQEWKELNCTADFTKVVLRVQGICQSLPQMLHHKDTLVQHLLDAVAVPNTMAIEPVCDLISLLARDLREELVPYVQSLLRTFAATLRQNALEPTTVESILMAMSFLFKYLVKYLVADLQTLCLTPLAELMVAPQPHIRQLLAVPLAFVLRKAGNATYWRFLFDMSHDWKGQALQNALDVYGKTILQAIQGHQGTLRAGAHDIIFAFFDSCVAAPARDGQWLDPFFRLYHVCLSNLAPEAGLALTETILARIGKLENKAERHELFLRLVNTAKAIRSAETTNGILVFCFYHKKDIWLMFCDRKIERFAAGDVA